MAKHQRSIDRTLISGALYITKNAREILNGEDINNALHRHLSCDWGDVCTTDWNLNDEAYKSGGRVLSSYTSMNNNESKFWIITEADRSATTILLPEDY